MFRGPTELQNKDTLDFSHFLPLSLSPLFELIQREKNLNYGVEVAGVPEVAQPGVTRSIARRQLLACLLDDAPITELHVGLDFQLRHRGVRLEKEREGGGRIKRKGKRREEKEEREVRVADKLSLGASAKCLHITSNTHLQLWGYTLKLKTRVVDIYASNDNYYIYTVE